MTAIGSSLTGCKLYGKPPLLLQQRPRNDDNGRADGERSSDISGPLNEKRQNEPGKAEAGYNRRPFEDLDQCFRLRRHALFAATGLALFTDPVCFFATHK